jgi:hypothetical protein
VIVIVIVMVLFWAKKVEWDLGTRQSQQLLVELPLFHRRKTRLDPWRQFVSHGSCSLQHCNGCVIWIDGLTLLYCTCSLWFPSCASTEHCDNDMTTANFDVGCRLYGCYVVHIPHDHDTVIYETF